MYHHLLKCIANPKEFDPVLFKELDLGVEIQDFAKSNRSQEEDLETIELYRTLLNDFKGTVTIHGPFIDLNPISPDLGIRSVSYDHYVRTLKIAKELNVDRLLFHSQINPWINIYHTKGFLQAYKKFWNTILEDVGGVNQTIVLENIFEDNPIQLKTLIESIDIPQVKACLDIGHSRIRNKTSLEEWFNVLGDQINYIHVHWNDRKSDLHEQIPDEEVNALFHYKKKYAPLAQMALEYKVDDLKSEIKRIKNMKDK